MRVGVRGILVLGCLLVAACSRGNAVAPTPVSPPSSLTLNSGPYSLTFTDASGQICQNGVCGSVMVCANAAGSATASEAFPVTVQRAGDQVVVAPDSGDSLRMVLQVSGISLTGTVSGTTAVSSGLPVTASGTIIGGPDGLTAGASGTFNGQLTIGSASCSSTGHLWRLTAR